MCVYSGDGDNRSRDGTEIFFPLLVFPRVNETTLRYTGRHKKVEGARSVPDVIWTVSSVPVVIPEFPLCNKKLYIIL